MAKTGEERTIEIIVNGQKANASLKEMSAAAAVLSNQVGKIAADDPKRAELIAQLQALKERITATRNEVNGLTQSEEQLAAAAADLAQKNQQTIASGKAAGASFNEMKAAAGLLEKQLHELGKDDPGRAAMIADFQHLKQRLEQTREELEKTRRSEAELRAEQVQLVVNGQKVSASMHEMKQAAAVLERELEQLARTDPGWTEKAQELNTLKQRLSQVSAEAGKVGESTSLWKQAFATAGLTVGIGEAVGLVKSIGQSIFETTAKFETYAAVMKNALGSESAAQKALKDIQKMAAATPFSVDELTASYLKFVNRGLEPSMADMAKMADLAASQGKSFDQLTEAVLDAGTGEFERLKEFGIQASKSGDQVSLSFKGVQKTVANTPEAIQGVLLGFGELNGVMGSCDAISKTLDGQLSNLGDTADQVAIQYGQYLKRAFSAVITVIGFFLGILKELPGFLVENRGLLLGLGVALATLNAAQIAASASALAHVAIEKGRAIATRASAAAQWLLNAALEANPIGLVVAAVALLVGAFVTLYEKSAVVRSAVAGLGQALLSFAVTYVQGLIKSFTGLGDILIGVFTLDKERLKKGIVEVAEGMKAMYYDSGKNAAGAFVKGYDEKMAAEQKAKAGRDENSAAEAAAARKKAEAAAKARAAAEAAARLEALKHEEATLKVRLALVQEGTEREMRLKQQLIGVQAKIELADAKKTADDKRVIEAEALHKQRELAREFYHQQAAEAKAAREKEDQKRLDALKSWAALEGKQEDLRIAAIGDKRKREEAQILRDAEKKIRELTGQEANYAEMVAGIRDEQNQRLQELSDKYSKEALDKQRKTVQEQLDAEEAAEAEREAVLHDRLAQALDTQAVHDHDLYEVKKASLERELLLIRNSLGVESAEYRKVRGEQLKLEQDHNKKSVEDAKKTKELKVKLEQASLKTASDTISFGIELLGQDEEARKKHHSLYVALSTAKILMDGYQEVAAIWRYSADVPGNAATYGAAGTILGGIQTALAVGRTILAISNLNDMPGYAAGGRTGDGMVVSPGTGQRTSPWSAMLEYSGMRVGSNGKLTDGSGFAVAGVVHEDEYVIPKWLRQDPQVAAFEQWVEAKRMRGYYEGGPTSGASAGRASADQVFPSLGSDDATGLLTEMLGELRTMNGRLADVENWQRQLQVRFDVHGHQKVTAGLKQVEWDSAIRKSR